MGWHEHVDGVFHGCENFFRPGYAANLVSSWIPALSDVEDKLEAGARVADIGCGKGASTLLMAKAFPKLDQDVVDIRPTSMSRNRKPLDPFGGEARRIFVPICFSGHAVRVSLERDRAVLQMRQDERRDPNVIVN
jgi:hypothetical protein